MLTFDSSAKIHWECPWEVTGEEGELTVVLQRRLCECMRNSADNKQLQKWDLSQPHIVHVGSTGNLSGSCAVKGPLRKPRLCLVNALGLGGKQIQIFLIMCKYFHYTLVLVFAYVCLYGIPYNFKSYCCQGLAPSKSKWIKFDKGDNLHVDVHTLRLIFHNTYRHLICMHSEQFCLLSPMIFSHIFQGQPIHLAHLGGHLWY